MSKQAVLFDLDGTLINTIPLIRLTFEKVFADFGIPWGNGEVLETIGLPLRQIAERYAPGRAEAFLEAYSSFQSTKHKELTKAYPGTIRTLQAVKEAGCRIAVVTSKRRNPALDGMALTGIDRYIDVAVTVEDVNLPKPDPEPVMKALKLLDAKPEDAVYIGDSWYDIQAGKQAGVTTVGVTWGMATRAQLSEHIPGCIVDSWDEFLTLLRTL